MISRYLRRVSGPLLDRIDIHIEVARLKQDELLERQSSESSAAIRQRVLAARQCQLGRFTGSSIYCNGHMNPRQMKLFCQVSDETKSLLRAAITQLNLSARAYDRILKLARTIADLAGEDYIQTAHVAEAVQYRSLESEVLGLMPIRIRPLTCVRFVSSVHLPLGLPLHGKLLHRGITAEELSQTP